jgi:hypothetical protein
LIAAWRDFFELVENIVRTGISEGHFREDVDPSGVAHDLYGTLLATHHRQRLLDDPRASELARKAFERLFDSVRNPS